MYFKRIMLFVFAFCVLVTNLNYSMDFKEMLQGITKGNDEIMKEVLGKIGNFCNEGMSVGKTYTMYVKIFSKHFKKRDLDKCVTIMMASNKFAKENGIEDAQIDVFQEFRVSENDDAFFKEIMQKVNAIEKKKKAERAKKNAKKKKNKEYAVDAYGRTELHNLVRTGNLVGVQAVLKSNCSAEYFNKRTKEGIHVLHYASGRANCDNGFEIAKLLINYVVSKNYDLNVQTIKKGRTPLDVAKDHEHTPLIDLLTQHGAH